LGILGGLLAELGRVDQAASIIERVQPMLPKLNESGSVTDSTVTLATARLESLGCLSLRELLEMQHDAQYRQNYYFL
jgi:hypothetical protein